MNDQSHEANELTDDELDSASGGAVVDKTEANLQQKKELRDRMKDLEAQDRMGNYEIQRL
jgi:hypothetical protein